MVRLLTARTKDILGGNDWQLQINSNDPNIVEFEYPASIETNLDYIRPQVVLELGIHAEPVPNGNYDITPFAAEHFPKLFTKPKCSIARVLPGGRFGKKRLFFMRSIIGHWINQCLCVIRVIMPMSQ